MALANICSELENNKIEHDSRENKDDVSVFDSMLARKALTEAGNKTGSVGPREVDNVNIYLA